MFAGVGGESQDSLDPSVLCPWKPSHNALPGCTRRPGQAQREQMCTMAFQAMGSDGHGEGPIPCGPLTEAPSGAGAAERELSNEREADRVRASQRPGRRAETRRLGARGPGASVYVPEGKQQCPQQGAAVTLCAWDTRAIAFCRAQLSPRPKQQRCPASAKMVLQRSPEINIIDSRVSDQKMTEWGTRVPGRQPVGQPRRPVGSGPLGGQGTASTCPTLAETPGQPGI